ncbi:MAG: methyltransferase domain-containing protein [Gemmatimonadota bacterium]|nr:methyltransferase domain-containing protein [Gemmatimonadota bacterium]MDH4352140.1 methyltransferase domain-containing protein [Gemmatimonadota bacterium]MDH5282313.1 methyltransferase domain-containing protein [Gemmatimonadota bacterium]
MTATLPPGDELLDHPDADPASVRESLHHIARSNRWFGGWWAVRRGLARLCAGIPRGTELTLLDLGTGSGDLPVLAARWAARRGLGLRALGLERHRTAARLASGRGIPTLLAAVPEIPARTASVDIVLASQLLHHLAPPVIAALCREASRVARRGVVMADLRRSPLALAGFWAGSRLLGFDRSTRADGITSVQRGFTREVLAAHLAAIGADARVEHSPGFRLVATWQTGRPACER